ncbi:MAG: TIGR02099 family protein [Gammaproteobacteria bacterium]|nr:TIGR02099 family protein [Gammaproteobacteria bacterium]
MKLFLWRCASLTWLAISAAIVLLAVLLTTTRILMPLLADYRQDIQDQLSMALGQTLSIGEVQAQWRGITPRIKLDDVKIGGAQGAYRQLRVGTIYLSLDVLNTVLSGAIRVSEIGLIGCDITIIRKPDHSIVVHGIDLSLPTHWTSTGAEAFETLSQSQIRLLDSRVRLKDEISGSDYWFEGVNISLSTEHDHNQIYASMRPPDELGSQLTVLMNFKGQLNRPQGWEGHLYVSTKDLRLEALSFPNFTGKLGSLEGELNLESWSDWRRGRPVHTTGSFTLKQAAMSLPLQGSTQGIVSNIDLLQGRFNWDGTGQGWNMQLADLEMTVDGLPWPKNALHMDYRQDDDGLAQFRSAVRYVNLQYLQQFFSRLPWAQEKVPAAFRFDSPSGELIDSQFSIDLIGSEVERYSFSSSVRDLDLPPRDGQPGIAGIDGWFRLDERGGEAGIDSRSVLFDYPDIFPNPLFANRLQAQIQWWTEAHRTIIASKRFSLANEDIEIQGQGSLVLGETSPYLDLHLSYGNGNGKRLGHYLPKKGISPRVYDWLKTSITDGHITSGTLVLSGELADFPFVQGNGVFEVDAQIEKAVLEYRPGWPKLEDVAVQLRFRGSSMKIIGSKAKVLDSELRDVSVDIENLKRAELRLEAQVYGPLHDLWAYTTQSILPSGEGRVVKDLQFTGDKLMSLNIYLPLSKKIKAPKHISGRVRFEDASLRFPESGFLLENLTGEFDFGPQGAEAKGIQARINGRPVTIDSRPGPNQSSLIEIRGNLGVEDLLSGTGSPLIHSFDGTSDWLAYVQIPHLKVSEQNRAIILDLWSGMQGTEVDLPRPLFKPADQQQTFKLNARMSIDGTMPLRVKYGKQLSAALSLRKSSGRYELMGGEVRFRQGDAVSSNDGFSVLGALPQYSMTAWKAWFKQTFDGHTQRLVDFDNERKPVVVDLNIDFLEVLGYEFKAVKLKAKRQGQAWQLHVDSPTVKGDLSVPISFDSKLPLVMDLDYLNLIGGIPGNGTKRLDPRQLPAMRFKSKQLQFDRRVFRDVALDANPVPQGTQIENLRLVGEDYSLYVAGEWRVSKNLAQESDLKLVLDSSDLGSMLKGLGLGKGFEEGAAQINAQLQFPRAPYQWGYEGLIGNAHIDLQKGRLRNLEPGLGRLLGLINIGALSRRLTLDFSDLFKEGFSYDNIEGHLSIEGENIYTQDMIVQGPAADIAIDGRLGLVSHDYDQRVTVTAKVSSGATVAGAILGGVGVGAAIFVADKIITSMGIGLDNVTRLQYKVTGAWDEPVVELISTPTENESGFNLLEDDLG